MKNPSLYRWIFACVAVLSMPSVDSDNHLGRCHGDGLDRWRGVAAA